MADNMTIGPALAIGGNKVEMLQTGKILVTNPKGKMKTLSQDEFKKQVIKNAGKIQSGEDFEFKKDRKGLKIAAIAVGTAAVVTSIIYYKKIGQFFNKLFKKAKPNNINNVNQRTVFNGELAPAHNANEARVARETLKMKNQATGEIAANIINDIERLKISEKGAVHNNRQKMYERLFAQK